MSILGAGEAVAGLAEGAAAILSKPIVIEFGGDGLCLAGRKRGKTDGRVLIKRLEVPTVDVLIAAVMGLVGAAAFVAVMRSKSESIDQEIVNLPKIPGINWGPIMDKIVPGID